MLFTLLQLSSYYADEDGWFFRSNADLQAQSRLSNKMVIAILSTFHRLGILEVKSVGQSKGTIPNKFRLLTDKFSEWENIRLEDCVKNPQYHVPLDDYKQRGYIPSYLSSEFQQTSPSTHNIENATNVDNTEIAENTQNGENADNEEKKEENIDTYQGTLGESLDNALSADEKKRNEFWYMVDYYLSRIQHASHWREWESHLTDLDQLLLNPPTSELGEQAKAKLSTILREEVQSYKRKYEDATTDKSGDVYDDYCSSNTGEVDDGDEELEEPDVETEAEDFYFQLREWKEYSKERDGAFSYFADEPIKAPY